MGYVEDKMAMLQILLSISGFSSHQYFYQFSILIYSVIYHSISTVLTADSAAQ